MCRILAPYDVEIWTSSSGNDAAQHWGRSIDLAITDQFMAEGDGWSVLVEATRHDVPTILISAAEPVRPKTVADSLQFAAVFQKPFDADMLIEDIERLLGGLRQRATATEVDTQRYIFERPAEPIIAPLRHMIRDGAVSAIDDWAEATAHQHPEHAAFLSLVRTANRRLDFDMLQELAGGRD